jgi:hypothetical protein
LRESLGELGSEIFYRLAGDLRFTSAPSLSDPPIDSRSYRRLKNLELDDRLSLRDLLKLRSDLTAKLELFNLSYQKVVEIDNRIPRDRSKQQWQQLDRQMQTIDRQVAKLCQLLDRTESNDLLKQRKEIDYQHKKLVGQQEVGNEDKLKALKSDRDKWQERMIEILDLAINKAKLNKVNHDLQTGDK